MDLSIVIPLYNEVESLPELSAWIRDVLHEHGFDYEVIFIDDGSTDGSWGVVEGIVSDDDRFKAVRFQRNYGKSAALNTGFAAASGDVVVTMDADLQDSPEEVPELHRMITEDGFDLVSGWKKKRYDPITKTLPTKLYNGVTRLMSGIRLHDMNCGLKAYRLDVVRSIEVYGDMHRYIPVLARKAGYHRIGEKVVQHQARKYGTTKFGLRRFVNGPLDLMSVLFITRFGKRPMHFFGAWGLWMFTVGLALTAWLIGEKAYYLYVLKEKARLVAENPLFYLALTAMIIGSQLFLAGFLGELVARSAPGRNDYLIRERLGC